MKVLYFSSVVPAELNAGYSLLHRHLRRMSAHDVLIITRDLPQVDRASLPHPSIVLPERSRNYLRVSQRIGAPHFWLERDAARLYRLALPAAARFGPEVVVSVWTSAYLLAAADLAKTLDRPLVLLFHDDFETMIPTHPGKPAWASRRLGEIFHQAAARLCVGPGMAEYLLQRHGAAPTDVLYPIPDDPQEAEPAPRDRRSDGPLRLCFFGELGGNHQTIEALVRALVEVPAELHFFSHSTGPERRQLAARPNVFDHGATDPRGLRAFVRSHMDAVVIPQGFEQEHLQLRRTCFPSKIPEACQIGLPLFVLGPAEGSAARWARVHVGPPAVVETLERAAIVSALRSLAQAATWQIQRERVRQAALNLFGPPRLHAQFESVLAAATAGARRSAAQPDCVESAA